MKAARPLVGQGSMSSCRIGRTKNSKQGGNVVGHLLMVQCGKASASSKIASKLIAPSWYKLAYDGM